MPAAPDRAVPGEWLMVVLVVSGLFVAVMMRVTGLIVAPRTVGFLEALAVMAPPACVRLALRHPVGMAQRRLRTFSEDCFVFLAMSLLGVLASYPAAAATRGFADPTLARIDALLGFDWIGWYRIVAAHRVLQVLGAAAYATIYVTPMLLLAWFAWTERRHDARRFLCTFWLAVVLTLAVFPLLPAEGPLAYLWHGPIPYMPTSALYQQQLIPALRAHRMTDIDLGALRGLVCAPSFHTASAVVFIAAAWPIAALRRIVVPLCLAMLLATPVEGTHYLADMIVGAAVALIAVGIVRAGLGTVAARAAPA